MSPTSPSHEPPSHLPPSQHPAHRPPSAGPPPSRRPRWRGALAALGAAPLLAAIVSVSPLGASEGVAAVPGLAWADCGDGVQCATAEVPLDHDRPKGPTITLALARRPATDPANRIGSLFVNNGGPGNSVLDFVRGDVTNVLPADVRARFDIVGFDPRGVGESTPVRCFDSTAEQQAFFATRPPFPVGEGEVRAFTEGSEELGRRCAQRNGKLLKHLSTANVARDMDLLRGAVGDQQLHFAGYSYGALLGLTYGNLLPERVASMVLDGIPDPAAYSAGGAEARREPVTTRVHGAAATERALDTFLDACQAAGPASCAFADDGGGAGSTTAKFDDLLARLDRQPVTIETPDGPLLVTRAIAVDNLRGALQFPPIWGDVAQLVQAAFEATTAPAPVAGAPGPEHEAAETDASGTDAGATDGDQPGDGQPRPAAASPAADAAYDNSDEAFLAVACSDTANPRSPAAWPQIARRAEQRQPHFGADWAWISQPCATWPAIDADRFDGPYTRKTASPVLFVNATQDAASDYDQARATAARVPGARLVTLEGPGHPATFVPNTCLNATVSAYLVDGIVPAEDLTCQPDQGPFG